MSELTEEELQELYAWVDEIPLSRQKKSFTRDFSDGVLAAEVVYHFLPKMVELHNFSPANASLQKVENWRTLNRKVFVRMNFSIPDNIIQGAAQGKPGVIEFILYTMRAKIENHLRNLSGKSSFNEEEMYIPPSSERYNPEDMVSTYQANTQLPWLQECQHRHIGAAGNGNYTTPPPPPPPPPPPHHHHHANSESPSSKKHYQHPSRIPVPSNSKQSSPRRVLPPLVPGERSFKQGAPQKRPVKYSYNKRTFPPSSNKNSSRDDNNSASIRLRLAERDQKLLETHEYIQYLQMKLTRYEHLVQIKDMKIQDLKKQLETNKLNGRQQAVFPYQRR